MKFETIKENAKRFYAGALGNWDRHITAAPGTLAKGSDAAMEAVLPFIISSQAEREEMREFAEAFQAPKGDWLAAAAKADGKGSAWNRVVLRAREAGLELIENWDVRQAGKLIELFPECVPAKYRGKQLTCFMADNEDCDWMVEVAEKPKHSASLGM